MTALCATRFRFVQVGRFVQSRELFTLDDGQTITARTFALRERGVTLGKGQRVRIKCGVAFCCAHVEVKEK